MMNKRNDTFATSLTAFSGPMTPFASANGSPHGVCTIRSTVQETVTAAASESRPVAKYFRRYHANEITRSAVGTSEIRSQIAYDSTVVAFIIPNSARAFPTAPRAVRAKSRCATCERRRAQIARWISASVAHTANAIDQTIVIQLIFLEIPASDYLEIFRIP